MNRLGYLLFVFAAVSQPLFSDNDILTWEMARSRALNESLDLSMDYGQIEVREGEETQAGLYDNPIFSYSVENVFGNKCWKGWRAAESRYEIAQPIVIGGKRCHATRAAEYRVCAAELGFEASQFAVLNQLSKAFLTVVAMQEYHELAEFQRGIAEKILDAVSYKLDAGKVSLIQHSKAALELVNAELSYDAAFVDLQVAKENLAVLFSSACPDFDQVDYPFFQINGPCSLEQCYQEIGRHPALLRAEYEQLAFEEELLSEKSSRIPDVIVSVGIKTVQNTHERGMTFGAMFPLPLFNRNQGNIQRVTAETRRMADQIDAVQIKLENRLSTVYKELSRSYEQALKFKTTVLQMAKSSFEFAKSGYEEGKFEYLDLLDATRTLFETQSRYIGVLLEYHSKCSDLEYLTL